MLGLKKTREFFGRISKSKYVEKLNMPIAALKAFYVRFSSRENNEGVDVKHTVVRKVSVAFAGAALLFAGVFFVTQSADPHTAELSFIEYSIDDSIIGSIIPASCNSTPPGAHYSGDSCPLVNGACTAFHYSCAAGTLGAYAEYGDQWQWWCNGSYSGSNTLCTQMKPVNGVCTPNHYSCSAGALGAYAEYADQWHWWCNGQYGGANAPLCVELKPPSLTLTASATTIDPESSATLTWVVDNASSCTASGGWSGAKSVSGGSQSITPAVSATYSMDCTGPGGSISRSVTVVVNPPVVNFTASPTLIGPGNSSTLTWTTKGASSCTASGGWSGSKATGSGSQSVTPPPPHVTTVYSLSCSGPSGTTNRSVTVTLPSGYINATNCTIPLEGTSCPSLVTWQANDFLSTPSVLQGSTQFSTASQHSGTGNVRPIHPDSFTFNLKDTGSAFIRTANASVDCATGSVWVSPITTCVTLPIITIAANPNLVRSGETAPVSITVKSNYPLVCTVLGATQDTFNHAASPSVTTYTRTTRPLTSAAIARIECTHPTYTNVHGSAETRVSVIPTIEEI